MNRRQWLAAAGSAFAASPALPHPTAAQRKWQDYEVGVVFHFDMPVFAPGGWKPYKQAFDPNLYQPAKLDTDQWLAVGDASNGAHGDGGGAAIGDHGGFGTP